VSVDSRAGRIQTHGWLKSTERQPEEWLEGLVQAGLQWVVVTDVERDGMLSGANLQLALRFTRDSNLRVVLAGGVSRMNDIHQARNNGLAGVIIGRALYSGELNLSEVLKELSDAG
jgi:phosphoribosylformimino-5-aminoimidazole carboxamide ribotide isomerase